MADQNRVHWAPNVDVRNVRPRIDYRAVADPGDAVGVAPQVTQFAQAPQGQFQGQQVQQLGPAVAPQWQAGPEAVPYQPEPPRQAQGLAPAPPQEGNWIPGPPGGAPPQRPAPPPVLRDSTYNQATQPAPAGMATQGQGQGPPAPVAPPLVAPPQQGQPGAQAVGAPPAAAQRGSIANWVQQMPECNPQEAEQILKAGLDATEAANVDQLCETISTWKNKAALLLIDGKRLKCLVGVAQVPNQLSPENGGSLIGLSVEHDRNWITPQPVLTRINDPLSLATRVDKVRVPTVTNFQRAAATTEGLLMPSNSVTKDLAHFLLIPLAYLKGINFATQTTIEVLQYVHGQLQDLPTQRAKTKIANVIRGLAAQLPDNAEQGPLSLLTTEQHFERAVSNWLHSNLDTIIGPLTQEQGAPPQQPQPPGAGATQLGPGAGQHYPPAGPNNHQPGAADYTRNNVGPDVQHPPTVTNDHGAGVPRRPHVDPNPGPGVQRPPVDTTYVGPGVQRPPADTAYVGPGVQRPPADTAYVGPGVQRPPADTTYVGPGVQRPPADTAYVGPGVQRPPAVGPGVQRPPADTAYVGPGVQRPPTAAPVPGAGPPMHPPATVGVQYYGTGHVQDNYQHATTDHQYYAAAPSTAPVNYPPGPLPYDPPVDLTADTNEPNATPVLSDHTARIIGAAVGATMSQALTLWPTTAPSSGTGSDLKRWTPDTAQLIAGYANLAVNDPGIPSFYKTLLQKQTKLDRETTVAGAINWLKTNMPQCRTFKPPSEFTKDVLALNFAPSYRSDQWHRGIFGLGPFFSYSSDEHQRQQHLEALFVAGRGTINQSINQAQNNQSRPPNTILDLDAFIKVLRQHSAFHHHTLGNHCPLADLSGNLATKLEDDHQHHIDQDWMRRKAASCIFMFNKAAYDFAKDVQTPQIATRAAHRGILATSKISLRVEHLIHVEVVPRVPSSLVRPWDQPPTPAAVPQLRTQPPPQPAPPQQPAGPAPPSQNPQPGRGRGRGRGGRQPPPAAPAGTTDAVEQQGDTHPNGSPPGYHEFWLSCGNDSRYRTTAFLQQLNLTMDQALHQLGLPANSCFNYHMRGYCSARNRLRGNHIHNGQLQPNPQAAANFLQQLRQAKANM